MLGITPALPPIACCRRGPTRAVPGAPWRGDALAIMTMRVNLCSRWRRSSLGLAPRASVGRSGDGSSGKRGPMGARGAYSQRRRGGTSAACGASPRSMSTPRRFCKSAGGGCALRPTDVSPGPSVRASPRPPARVSARSGSSARGWRGRERGAKAS